MIYHLEDIVILLIWNLVKSNLYGDIFILKFIKNTLCDLTIEDYSVFYNDQFDTYSDFESDSDSEIAYEIEIE